MDDLKRFKRQILIHTLAAAALFELLSLPFLRLNIQYSIGLLAGTCVSVISFNLLTFMSERALKSSQKWMASLGYLIRLPLYGVAFFFCMKYAKIAGLACLLGFLTGIIAVIYVHGIKAKFTKKGGSA